MSDTSIGFIERLSITLIELMQEVKSSKSEVAMLRKEVLDLKDMARSCACFQQDDFK